MAGTKIRGVTIELNADTAGILDGIKDLNSSLSKTDKALKDVNKLLKFDDSNTELLAQQQNSSTSTLHTSLRTTAPCSPS